MGIFINEKPNQEARERKKVRNSTAGLIESRIFYTKTLKMALRITNL